MKSLHLLEMGAAMATITILAAANIEAQRPVSRGPRITFPSHANHFSWERHHGFHGGVFIVERQVPVIVEREVVREVKVADSGTLNRDVPKSPRKPYVIGTTYPSLPPQGCMKLIEDGASYYYCSGEEWYRQLGDGRGAQYRAVARP